MNKQEISWVRYTAMVEADSLEEAKALMEAEDDSLDISSETLFETSTQLTPVERYLLNNIDACLPDEIDLEGCNTVEFDEDRTYQIHD